MLFQNTEKLETLQDVYNCLQDLCSTELISRNMERKLGVMAAMNEVKGLMKEERDYQWRR